jgi:hypothetical protein
MDYLLTGAHGGWRGVCLVFYANHLVQDLTNGATCMAYTMGNSAGSGPTDLGGIYFVNIGPATWVPPAMSA